MANDPVFPFRWSGLPDRRPTAVEGANVDVEVHESDWRKIVQKHFGSSKEPWGDLLDKAILDGLTSNGGATPTGNVVIRQQIAASLGRPLFIQYTCIGPQVSGQGHRWILVFPCGALAVVWAAKSTNRLKTCYFTGSVAVKPKAERWKHAVRQQIEEYAKFDEVERVFRHPAANERREVSVTGGTTELRYAIQFVSADVWGFESNEAGAAWRIPVWRWPESNLNVENPSILNAGNPKNA